MYCYKMQNTSINKYIQTYTPKYDIQAYLKYALYEVICFDIYTHVRVNNFAYFFTSNIVHSGLNGVALKQSLDCFQSGW